ncbi:T9SS type A sorting domain-containing protein [Bacteroidota bacterium]
MKSKIKNIILVGIIFFIISGCLTIISIIQPAEIKPGESFNVIMELENDGEGMILNGNRIILRIVMPEDWNVVNDFALMDSSLRDSIKYNETVINNFDSIGIADNYKVWGGISNRTYVDSVFTGNYKLYLDIQTSDTIGDFDLRYSFYAGASEDDSFWYQDDTTLTIRLTDHPVFINNIDLNKEWLVYPNPFISEVFINNCIKGARYDLFNINGTLTETGIIESERFSINPNCPKGKYFLRITDKESYKTFKLIKY